MPPLLLSPYSSHLSSCWCDILPLTHVARVLDGGLLRIHLPALSDRLLLLIAGLEESSDEEDAEADTEVVFSPSMKVSVSSRRIERSASEATGLRSDFRGGARMKPFGGARRVCVVVCVVGLTPMDPKPLLCESCSFLSPLLQMDAQGGN